MSKSIGILDREYLQWVKVLSIRYRQSQIKAAVKVNRVLLEFYWELGSDIVTLGVDNKYGDRFYATLSTDLRREMPGIDGLSESNLRYAKRFFQLYSGYSQNLQQVVEELCSIPWGHHIRIIDKCSDNPDKTLFYVRQTLTYGIRQYLSMYQEQHKLSKVTIDNMRRIFSSFFAWLEDEDYIAKSPVRRIHKVKTDSLVKEVLSDEQLEQLRDNCTSKRDLAIIDILASTGIRVGELVKLNRTDIDFHERQCIVFGKGNKERMVYFNARTKLHLQQYLNERADTNPALFVSLSAPHNRLSIGGVEVCIRKLGRRLDIPKVHPHKFRRTLATMAIDKGMPIEQVQRLLGHVRIDTTLHYAIVNQNNVKIAHKRYLS